MKTKLMAALGVVVLVVAAVAGTMVFGSDADAQDAGHYEYGYLVPVPQTHSYEADVKRWTGSEADKKFMETHVFVYEEGATLFDRRVNSLRRINDLAGQGWELHDAQAGVLRRKK